MNGCNFLRIGASGQYDLAAEAPTHETLHGCHVPLRMYVLMSCFLVCHVKTKRYMQDIAQDLCRMFFGDVLCPLI